MKTFTNQLSLRTLEFSKLLILTLLITLPFSVRAQISGYLGDETPKYDFSDFKPLTAQKFLETNFDFIKTEYLKSPETLIKGYRIEIIPSKRQGFRPSVSTHQIYGQLVDKAVLEWAQKNNYTVYLDNGYKIVKKLDSGTEITVNIATGRWDPPTHKTVEQDFRARHNRPNTKFSKLHGILSAESVNSIELLRTKYGAVYGEIYNPDNGNNKDVNLTPLKDMMNSVLDFCDQKIEAARSLFLKKINVN